MSKSGLERDVTIIGADIIQPVDIQSHYQQTIQNINAVSLPATTGSTTGTWIDCDGFDRIAWTVMNDAGTSLTHQLVWSHDGTTQHGTDQSISATNRWQINETSTKARYVRVFVSNPDAAAHTVSAWIYLKA
jgi:hypothetical protein